MPARPISNVQFKLKCGHVEHTGVPLELGLGEFKLGWWQAKSGDTIRLPKGDYGVGPALQASAIRHWVQEKLFTVRGDEDTTIVMDAPSTAGWVKLELSTPHGPVDQPMGVSVMPEIGSGFTIANWYTGCDRDPLRLFLPLGRTVLRAGMPGYKTIQEMVTVTNAEQVLVMHLEYAQ